MVRGGFILNIHLKDNIATPMLPPKVYLREVIPEAA